MARRAGALAGLALAAASCGGSPEPPLPPSASTMRVDMEEYRFVFRAPAAPGRVVLRARNTGRQEHELVLLPLPEDFPPIAEQLKG
ncbi:MAG TPA: hypothetical protein VG474_10885, partial [Solirubrobacteraceae bacterium]|nr:hypothetical protein [Solirubrobacteraceae bacterium]